MDKSRFFAFGCSYTKWTDSPTWADFIGINFEKYHNFGTPGACNTYIMHKLIEADGMHCFNPETDFVIVALTGFGRFTYLEMLPNPHIDDGRTYVWQTHGDILFPNDDHPTTAKLIRDKVYNFPWAAYDSWISFKIIKELLTLKGINHKIIMSINNSHYIENTKELYLNHKFDNIGAITPKIQEIYNSLDVLETIDEYRYANHEILYPYDKNGVHPNKQIYYDYCMKHFPELITFKSKDLLDTPDEIWKTKFN
jgi:hypothetical protein